MGDFAAQLRHIADQVAARGAHDCANAMSHEFIRLTLPHTPVRSGALRRSIRATEAGGGLVATSSCAPHTVYAAIINFGGTIRVKHTYTTKNGRTLPGFLSNGSAFFGRSVVIPGQGYWNLDGKQGACGQAGAAAVSAIIKAG